MLPERDGGIVLGRGRWFCSTLMELSMFWEMQMCYIKHSKTRAVVRKRTEFVPALMILRSSDSELADEFGLLCIQTGRASGPSNISKMASKEAHRLNPPLSNSIDSQKPRSQRWNESQSLKQRKCYLLFATSVHFSPVFLIIFSLVSFSISPSLLFCLCSIIHWAPSRLLPTSLHNTFQLCNYAIVIKSLRCTLNMY